MSNERNVVVLGKVGSGKKTLVNHILGADVFPRGSAVGGSDVRFHWTGEQWKGDMLYRILIIDTEGIQTVFSNPLPTMKKFFQQINLIIFVIANGRYTDESHSSLVKAVNSLHQRAKQVTALVITHCEDLADVERKAIVDEFIHDARTYQVRAFIGNGTYTVGFPNPSKQNLKVLYASGIAEDERNIRKLVDESKNTLDVKDLAVQIVQPLKKQRSLDSGPLPPFVGIPPLNHSQRPTQAPQLPRAGRDLQQQEVPTAMMLKIGTDDIPLRADPVQQSTTRTIIMLGTTGAGKKTIGKRIAGKDIFNKESTVGYGKFSIGEMLYQIQIVDTDKIHTGQYNPMLLIQKFEAVHLIIFVIPYGKYTDESHRELMHIVQNLRPNAVPISTLLFTHCDGITEEGRRGIISSFRTEPATIPLAAFMGKSIYTVGFAEPSRPPVKMEMEEEIAKDEFVLKKLVHECNFSVPVNDIPVQNPVPFQWHSPTPQLIKITEHYPCCLQ